MRVIAIDYIKAIAIYLVILGHIFSNCIENGYDSTVNGIIYFIHIPLFLFISGYLAKDKQITKTIFWKNIILRFIIPYTTWTIILSSFYIGIKGIMNNDISVNAIIYFNNWCHSFLWFIKVYIIIYVLWQLLQELSFCKRFIMGIGILIIINIVFINNNFLSELFSLSLYSYTLFAFGACCKQSIDMMKPNYIIYSLLVFAICLPFATTSNNYFECSFKYLYYTGNWYIFIIRFIAGISISIFLLLILKRIKYNNKINFIQSIGRNTLQIYMLQSLVVEAALNRFIFLPNKVTSYLISVCLAILMTFLCSLFIRYSSHNRIINILLWGQK